MKRPIPRVADAARRLDGEKCSATDAQIQIIAGSLQTSLLEIHVRSAQHAVVVDGDIQRAKRLDAGIARHRFIKFILFSKSGSAVVGQIVCDHMESIHASNQTSKGSVISAIHLRFSVRDNARRHPKGRVEARVRQGLIRQALEADRVQAG